MAKKKKKNSRSGPQYIVVLAFCEQCLYASVNIISCNNFGVFFVLFFFHSSFPPAFPLCSILYQMGLNETASTLQSDIKNKCSCVNFKHGTLQYQWGLMSGQNKEGG